MSRMVRGLLDGRHLGLLNGTWLHNLPRPYCFDWKLAEWRRSRGE